MNIEAGETTEFLVVAGSGRVVASYGDNEQNARTRIEQSREGGVNLRLFKVERTATELEHP